jgi:glycine cleavage system protein P-like pyridoxal-binding family
MNPTKVNALHSLRPGAEWVLRGDDLEWLDQAQTEPTEAEIQAELDRLIAEQPRKIAQAARATAYTTEADPLFFKVQRGEAAEAEWLAKVDEIRARFPYPEQP